MPSNAQGSRKLEPDVRGPWTVLRAVGNDVNYVLRSVPPKMYGCGSDELSSRRCTICLALPLYISAR
jgi:hypothetical protein